MTQEEKQLLLIDLCGRLSYGVKFILSGGNVNNVYTMKGIDLIVTDEGDWDYGVTAKNTEPIEIKYIKPYLRPMSSMTEEEENEYNSLNAYEKGVFPHTEEAFDWLNENMFDYRGLIPKGLALEAKEGMYKID